MLDIIGLPIINIGFTKTDPSRSIERKPQLALEKIKINFESIKIISNK